MTDDFKAHHNILIGVNAGSTCLKDDSKYIFAFTIPNINMKTFTERHTQMTPEEFEVVNAVVRRCIDTDVEFMPTL